MTKPQIKLEKNNQAKQLAGERVRLANARPSSNGCTAQPDPSTSSTPSPPANDRSGFKSYEALEVQNRLQKVLALLLEVDLQRIGSLLGNRPEAKIVHGLEPDTVSRVPYNAGDGS